MKMVLGTAFVGLILAAIVVLVIVSLVRRHKRGYPSSCAGGCANCPYANGCKKKED